MGYWQDDYGLDDAELESKLPTGSMLSRVYPYLRPHLASFLTAFALSLAAVAMTLGQPLVLKRIIDVNVPAGDLRGLFHSSMAYLGLMVGSGLIGMASTVLLGRAGILAVNSIKRDLFAHFLDLGVLWAEKLPVGTLVSRIESDSQRLVALTSTMMSRILSAIGVLLGALVVLAAVDRRLFGLAMLIIPVMLGGTLLLFTWLRPRFRKERSLYAKLTGILAEFIPAARFLQVSGRLGWAEERLRSENLAYNDFQVRLAYLEYSIFHGLGFLEVAMTVLALWLGARWIQEGSITIGSLVLFAQYIAQVYWPIIALSEQLAEVQRAGGAADRIFSTLDAVPDVRAPAEPAVLPARPASIRFEDVGFEYEKGKPVVSGISFSLERGKTLALVGPTGGGKTTLVNLVCRFMDPTVGRVLLDGQDLRDFDPQKLRRLFGLVLQDLYLFPATVLQNLRAFRDDVPEAKVEEAARTAGLHELIAARKGGYSSALVERGKDLSYGQRQLMAFARALTVDPPVLILDEATSSVDPGAERKIQETLGRLTQGRTTLVVAHRLSTIRQADRILVIEGGRIREEGDHDSLMRRDGHYADLVKLQTGEDPDA